MKLSFQKVRDSFVSNIEKIKLNKKDKTPIILDICKTANNRIEIVANTKNNKYLFTFVESYDNFDLSIFDKKDILLDRIITNQFTDIILQIQKQ